MPLLKSTLFAAVLLIPGVLSLAIALAPRGRGIRHSSLSSRVFGLIFFSVADWALAIWLYSRLVRNCSPTLVTLLFGADKPKNSLLADILTFPSAVWLGAALMAVAIIATGGVVGLFHSAAMTGMALHDFRLKCELPPCKHRLWALPPIVTVLWCPRCRHRWCLRVSRLTDRFLRSLGLVSVFQPLGAGYWLVILKAAQVLQWSSPTDEGRDRIARVYVDVVQGDENVNGKIGVLFKGIVKHLVCETDGNIVFLLLEQPSRWRGSKKKRVDGTEEIVLPSGDRGRSARSPWCRIEKSAALALEGRSIRNISFRLVDKPFTVDVKKDAPWKDLKEALGPHADQVRE